MGIYRIIKGKNYKTGKANFCIEEVSDGEIDLQNSIYLEANSLTELKAEIYKLDKAFDLPVLEEQRTLQEVSLPVEETSKGNMILAEDLPPRRFGKTPNGSILFNGSRSSSSSDLFRVAPDPPYDPVARPNEITGLVKVELLPQDTVIMAKIQQRTSEYVEEYQTYSMLELPLGVLARVSATGEVVTRIGFSQNPFRVLYYEKSGLPWSCYAATCTRDVKIMPDNTEIFLIFDKDKTTSEIHTWS